MYPLKFNPIFKDKLWGGKKIKTVLGKDFGKRTNCGETWELSGVEDNISVVKEGLLKGQKITDLIELYQGELVGESVFKKFRKEFPLLVKFIDANQDLSVQVHPDDKLAMRRHQSFGKTEMWYIMQADANATLISGFRKETSREEYLAYFGKGKLMELLNREEAYSGDVFFLPAGRVHTIGKGLLLAEIQQTSDITYRIYDFDRIDSNGQKRELHVNQALNAIDFTYYGEYKTRYKHEINTPVEVISTPFFTTNKLKATMTMKLDRSEWDSFKIYIAVGGEGKIADQNIRMGEVILVPASLKEYQVETDSCLELLETYIEV